MTTFVSGPLRRPVGLDSFADITPAAVTSFAGGVTFDADLTPTQAAAVAARIRSRNDLDQTARTQLDGLLAALEASETANPQVKALLAALTDYVLDR